MVGIIVYDHSIDAAVANAVCVCAEAIVGVGGRRCVVVAGRSIGATEDSSSSHTPSWSASLSTVVPIRRSHQSRSGTLLRTRRGCCRCRWSALRRSCRPQHWCNRGVHHHRTPHLGRHRCRRWFRCRRSHQSKSGTLLRIRRGCCRCRWSALRRSCMQRHWYNRGSHLGHTLHPGRHRCRRWCLIHRSHQSRSGILLGTRKDCCRCRWWM